MEKYKICPACGTHNPTNRLECLCGEDLTGVPMTDDEKEAAKAAVIESEATVEEPEEQPSGLRPQPKMVRICACGEKNLPNARKCKACGEDISAVLPQMICGSPNTYVFESMDSIIAHTFSDEEELWGREHVLSEYLQGHRYVSREQCRLFISEGKMYVENKSHTNPTFVNNEAVDAPRELKDGDILSLGAITKNGEMDQNGAYFMVRIRSCT